MKRHSLLLLIALCVAAMLPVTAFAASFALSGTDIQLQVDEDYWYVFTRDNIKNNPELDELGISYDQMNSILQDNSAYMDAILLYDDGDFIELFVIKQTADVGVVNLSNYSDEKVESLAKAAGKKANSQDYMVYKTQYKFAWVESFDKTMGYYLCQLITVVNGDTYTISFQSPYPFTPEKVEWVEEIVDSIRFDVDATLKEENTESNATYTILTRTLAGAAAGGAVGLVVGLVGKNKKKKAAVISASDESL